MNKLQLSLIGFSILLLLGLFFGASIKPSNYTDVEKQRSLVAASTDISSLLIGAKPDLSSQETAFIVSLEQQIHDAESDSIRVELNKRLASKWYEYGRPDISGYYAEQVALLAKTEEAWSITGTTFTIGSRQAKEDKIKRFCVDKAISAFESAISINAGNVSHKVNLATCYAENPPSENPMKGVMMLLDLNKEHPENVAVLVTLGRLGIQTGQFEKAQERLNKAISLDANNAGAYCLLAEALAGLGNQKAASEAQQKCQSLQQREK